MFRFDLLFSYWIFLWYIVYILSVTTYNPTFALVFAALENFMMLAFMYKTKIDTVIFFIIIIVLFKLIPLANINRRIHTRDIYATMILFFIYCVWLYVNGHTLYYVFKVSKDVIDNKTDLPFTSVVKSFLKIKRNE